MQTFTSKQKEQKVLRFKVRDRETGADVVLTGKALRFAVSPKFGNPVSFTYTTGADPARFDLTDAATGVILVTILAASADLSHGVYLWELWNTTDEAALGSGEWRLERSIHG
jgi:hypothetical protein